MDPGFEKKEMENNMISVQNAISNKPDLSDNSQKVILVNKENNSQKDYDKIELDQDVYLQFKQIIESRKTGNYQNQ